MKILKEAKRLHKLGFSLIWLRPKSKAPIEFGWTKKPRAKWLELKEGYRASNNMGVRLGGASQLGGFDFLAAIDCDVKSADPKHLKEMEAALRKLRVPTNGPRVLSGRGNGSCHMYVRTTKPATPQRLSQSSTKVRVAMPSVMPSRHERTVLSESELAKGIRLRPAWEISLMGEGQQCALPPSIHPDTGREYKWGKPFESADEIPTFKPKSRQDGADRIGSQTVAGRGSKDRPGLFEVAKISIGDKRIPEETRKQIKDGENIEDRSAALFGVTATLRRCGLKDNEVLSLLTDRQNFLGETAYDHAKTNSREKAARWLRRYTLDKINRDLDLARHFADQIEEQKPLSKKEAEKQSEELTGALNWREEIERNKIGAPPKCTLKNIILILSNAVSPDLFRHNDFSLRETYGVDAPWGGRRGEETTDMDAVAIKVWLADHFRFEPPVGLIFEAMSHLAQRNAFHPVRDYLDALRWDERPRLDTWLKHYLNAKGPDDYLASVSRKVLVAAVKRIYEPGAKFDHLLILEGAQGIGKSSAARILASPEWFADSLPDVKDKDARLNLLGTWIVEIGELAVLKRADSETYKGFFSAQADRVRAPYGKKVQEFKRQCIFIGTTNQDDYLRDKTGNRRFWPVEVGQCDFKGLMDARDQLFAEAKWVLENFDEELYLEGDAKKQAEAIQKTRVAEDVGSIMQDAFQHYLAENDDFGKERFRLADLFMPGGVFEGRKEDGYTIQVAARILKMAGFERYTVHGLGHWRKKREKPPTLKEGF
jgi:predicted P-loop ATPase